MTSTPRRYSFCCASSVVGMLAASTTRRACTLSAVSAVAPRATAAGTQTGAPASRRGVTGPVEHRLHCQPHAVLCKPLAQELLRHAEVFGSTPAATVEGSHGADVTGQHSSRFGIVGVDVDSAFCTPTGQVEGAVLVGHGARQALDLVQGDARAHPRAAAGQTVDHSVTHRVALAPGDGGRPDHPQAWFRFSLHVAPPRVHEPYKARVKSLVTRRGSLDSCERRSDTGPCDGV